MIELHPILIFFSLAALVHGQSSFGNSDGFPKTAFSCRDRPAGYYADIETGCQFYHMCDGLGRQFTYACPNTTLFQQRMLVCDHWYMVNCSRAENDYSANLLIGQQDKPFVDDKDNQLRTPRPDLLDRPYAADYSGESFRNYYKIISSGQNKIPEDRKKYVANKVPPIRFEITNNLEKPLQLQIPTPFKRTKIPFSATKTSLIRRSDEMEDLGTSHSLRYNTSADILAEDIAQELNEEIISTTTSIPQLAIKIPSKFYEPPFLYPLYDFNETSTESFAETDTAKTFKTILETLPSTSKRTSLRTPSQNTVRTSKSTTVSIAPSTTVRTTQQPTIPSTLSTTIHTTSTAFKNEKTNKFIRNRKIINLPYHSLLPPYKPKGRAFQLNNIEETSSGSNFPPVDILPPYLDFTHLITSTTQIPRKNYEIKIPSNQLLPPKLGSDLNVIARISQIDDTVQPSIQRSSHIKNDFQSINNPSLSPIFYRNKGIESSTKSPTQRSIHNSSARTRAQKISEDTKDSSVKLDIKELQREYVIPDFTFPLEYDGRTGYDRPDALNSFQYKVATEINNLKCPPCHPIAARASLCAPCNNRR